MIGWHKYKLFRREWLIFGHLFFLDSFVTWKQKITVLAVLDTFLNWLILYCGTSKAQWSFFAINVRKYFSILGCSASFSWWFHFCGKQSRYPLPAGMSWSNDVETTFMYVYTTLFQCRLTMMAIISTLLFQINIFERYSRSKIKNDTNFLLRFRYCWTININDDINVRLYYMLKLYELNMLK